MTTYNCHTNDTLLLNVCNGVIQLTNVRFLDSSGNLSSTKQVIDYSFDFLAIVPWFFLAIALIYLTTGFMDAIRFFENKPLNAKPLKTTK
ncbi:MAG: hypothetical protein QW134_05605 [Nitrososphaeria archaeon]